jgi:hypothetical protein
MVCEEGQRVRGFMSASEFVLLRKWALSVMILARLPSLPPPLSFSLCLSLSPSDDLR